MPLRGAQELRAKLDGFRKSAPAAMGAALYEEAIAAIGKADKDVPYEFGHLRRSHFVELPKDGPRGPSIEFGYGAGYGLYVHEVPANHPKGGKDHFLRDACNERMNGISSRLAKRVEAHLANGTGIATAGVPSERPDPMEAINAQRASESRAAVKRAKTKKKERKEQRRKKQIVKKLRQLRKRQRGDT